MVSLKRMRMKRFLSLVLHFLLSHRRFLLLIEKHTVWKTLEDHYALMNDKVVYPQMGEIMSKCIVAPPKMFHVLLGPATQLVSALHAPILSINQVFELKPGCTGEGLTDVINKLIHLSGENAPTKSAGGSIGKLVERDEYMLLFGWDVVAVSHVYVADDGRPD